MTVGSLIRRERYTREMGFDELVRRAGVSRSALAKLEADRTARPRPGTLRRIAKALDVPLELLLGPAGQATPTLRPSARQAREFDRQTNPLVEQIAVECPALFRNWTQADWDELYSEFGVGGSLTREGVVARASSINSRRELIQKVQIVLETDLAEALAGIVDLFYRLTAARSSRAVPGKPLEPCPDVKS